MPAEATQVGRLIVGDDTVEVENDGAQSGLPGSRRPTLLRATLADRLLSDKRNSLFPGEPSGMLRVGIVSAPIRIHTPTSMTR
jgi:hypothetical protein